MKSLRAARPGWVAHPSAFFAEGGGVVFKSVLIRGKKIQNDTILISKS